MTQLEIDLKALLKKHEKELVSMEIDSFQSDGMDAYDILTDFTWTVEKHREDSEQPDD